MQTLFFESKFVALIEYSNKYNSLSTSMQSNSNTPIIILSTITGIIHLGIGISLYPSTGDVIDLMLLLNGIGFLTLSSIFILNFVKQKISIFDDQQKLFFSGFLGFTLITIIAYFVNWGLDAFSNPVGIITKLIEAILVYFLFNKYRSL